MKIGIIIYIIEIILIILFRYILKKEKTDKLFLKVSFTVLLLSLFVRKPISDMGNYLNYFHYLNNCSLENFFKFDLEILYKILNLFIGKIWLNDTFFMIVIAFITSIGPYFLIKKYSKNYGMSILLYISIGSFYMQFFIIRQAIAISILSFSLIFIEKRKFIKYAMLVVIASLFHTSALFFIIVYPFCIWKNKKMKFVVFSTASAIAYIFKEKIVSLIIHTGYASYLTSAKYGYAGSGYGALVMFIIIILLCYLFDNKEDDREKEMFYSISFIGIIIHALAPQLAILGRLSNYFCDSYCILPVNIFEKSLKDNTKILNFCIIVCTFIYLFLFNQYTNYSFIWIM